jgi:hypothetical protein
MRAQKQPQHSTLFTLLANLAREVDPPVGRLGGRQLVLLRL